MSSRSIKTIVLAALLCLLPVAPGLAGSAQYTYDSLNRLTGANVGGQAYTYTYTGASPLVQSLTRPNGSVTTYNTTS